MTTTAATAALERELLIEARPEIVFRLLTDPVEILKWQGLDVETDARPGGVYRCVMNALGHTVLGEYIEVTPHSRIVFTWGWQHGTFDIPAGSTTVEFTLTPVERGTRLHLLHRGPPARTEIVESHTMGWTRYLDRLATVAAGRDPGPDDWATGEMGEAHP